MKGGSSVAVIIPARNEEAPLPHVLRAIPPWVDRVVVVDNGSTDRTAAVASAHGARVVPEPQRGYGAACLAGIESVGDEADVLVFLDADYSDVPEEMDRLVDPIRAGRADLVIGSRALGRCDPGALTAVQRFGNALSCWWIARLWKHRYTDLGPFRAIRRDALRRLSMDDRTWGWTIQMQIRALNAGVRVHEVPVDYRRRIGRSKISGTIGGVVRAGAKIIWTLVRERFTTAPVHAPHRAGKFGTGDETGEALLVFTRFPEPGRSKTRMIPALGADGAARLQRWMTRRVLTTADRIAARRGVRCEVHYAGGDEARMRGAFGAHRVYRPQADGDLGRRMARAIDGALNHGARRVVVVGADCPAMTADHLGEAFSALQSNDLVIGPSRDGGYYLIGCRRLDESLFDGIDWGTDRVLQSTLDRVRRSGLSVHLLPELNDIDEPADLDEPGAGAFDPADDDDTDPGLVSIVIPTLNEEDEIVAAIESARQDRGVEIIVVDGGSRDRTRRLAVSAGARVLDAPTGRAAQLNVGAAAARGDALLFLHADTRLPANYVAEVRRILARPNVAAGAFSLTIDARGAGYRALERLIALRFRLFRLPYGDQALFMSASTFDRMGGYPEWPVLEDLELVRRAGRLGRIERSGARVRTSSRCWRRRGLLRMTLLNQICIAAHWFGASPSRIAAWRRGSPDSPSPAQASASRSESSSSVGAGAEEPGSESTSDHFTPAGGGA